MIRYTYSTLDGVLKYKNNEDINDLPFCKFGTQHVRLLSPRMNEQGGYIVRREAIVLSCDARAVNLIYGGSHVPMPPNPYTP